MEEVLLERRNGHWSNAMVTQGITVDLSSIREVCSALRELLDFVQNLFSYCFVGAHGVREWEG